MQSPGSSPGPAGPSPASTAGTFASLRYREYRLLWMAQASHALALWLEQIARPLLVIAIAANPAVHIGGVVATRMAPQLLLGVWAGVAADRFPRTVLLRAVKTVTWVIYVAFAVLLVTGDIALWHLYALSLLRGTFMAFDQPARRSLMADILPQTLVTNGMALMSSTSNIMRILGALSSGAIIQVFGFDWTFIAIAAVYTIAVLSTWLLRVPAHARRSEGRGAPGMVRDLIEGGRFAFARPAIRGVLGLSAIYFTFGMSWIHVFAPLFVAEIFALPAFGFSVLIALFGLGSLAGSLVIAHRRPVHLGAILPTLVIAMGITLIVFALTTFLPRPAGLALPYLVAPAAGLLQTSFVSLSNSVVLTAAPDHMRGRILGLLSLDRSLITVGGFTAGILTAVAGVQVAQLAYGAAVVSLGLVLFLLAPGLRAYRVGDEIHPPNVPLP